MDNEHKPWSEYETKYSSTNTFKKKDRKKQFIFAFCSSICICVLFGIVNLNIIKQEEQHHALLSHTNNSDIGTEDHSAEVDATKLDSIHVYVVQGGVFSEEENAKEWQEKFNNIQFPAMNWYRNDNYFLFVGV